MVTVINFKTNETPEGKSFCSLQVQGGIEPVQSKAGKFYLTARAAWISTTFTEEMCKNLIGTSLPGKVTKVEVDPYEYTVKDSGEVIILDHKWAYTPEEDNQTPKQELIIPQHLVIG